MLAELMKAWGTEKVSAVASAEEALDLLSRERFTLILSDYRLEGMDGVKFLEQVRQSGDLTPVLLLTGAPQERDIIRAVQQPNVDVFAKPFRLADLNGAMQRLLAA
jgi:CheY-like chemotaxis protein